VRSLGRNWRPVLALALSLGAMQASAQPAPRPFLGGDRTQDEILERLESGVPFRFRQVGTTSVTMRIDLGEGYDAAYKPRTHSHPRGYLAEIAAYRVARALGMDNVPPVLGRPMNRLGMQNRFETDHPEDWEPIRREILWDAPGVARGAAIYWIPRMRSSELHEVSGLEAVADWLRIGGEVPDDRADLARDLSTMLAFDYLIGNWDRFSGGNVSTDAEGRRLFVRDHNVAFQDPLTGTLYDRVRGHLERTQRFSRSFVEALRELDEARLRAALEEDPEAEVRPLLSPVQIEGVMDRRRALLSYVGGLVALHGAERVLVWP
jgi:hypothetical protein